MATRVKGILKEVYLILDSEEEVKLHVMSFQDGIAVIKPPDDMGIVPLSKIIAGCFKTGANVETKLRKAFDSETTLTGIQFEFDGITMLVTKANANWITIYQEYYAHACSRDKRCWNKENLGRIERIRQLRETEEFQFRNQKLENQWKEDWGRYESLEDNKYMDIMNHAENWALCMQELMKQTGKPISQIADDAVKEVIGTSMFLIVPAANLLFRYWKDGDMLQKWARETYYW